MQMLTNNMKYVCAAKCHQQSNVLSAPSQQINTFVLLFCFSSTKVHAFVKNVTGMDNRHNHFSVSLNRLCKFKDGYNDEQASSY